MWTGPLGGYFLDVSVNNFHLYPLAIPIYKECWEMWFSSWTHWDLTIQESVIKAEGRIKMGGQLAALPHMRIQLFDVQENTWAKKQNARGATTQGVAALSSYRHWLPVCSVAARWSPSASLILNSPSFIYHPYALYFQCCPLPGAPDSHSLLLTR